MDRASLLITNANILTMDFGNPTAQAVAVSKEGRILAAGSVEQVGNLAGAETRVLNLNGKTLIPGFFDCHMHILWLGTNLGHVNLSSPPVADKEDIIRLLQERLRSQPDLTCVEGNSYDQNRLPGAKHLTRYDLDRVSTELPVYIVAVSGHAAVGNSRALELLGINRDTENPIGGEIVRDEKGEPTGVLLETASWNNLERILPRTTTSEAVEALERANRYLLERGITSATDANTAEEEVAWFAEAVVKDQLRVRTNCMIGWADIMKRVGEGEIPSPDDLQPTDWAFDWNRLHVGQAKLFSDGAITTRTCWLTQPFNGMPDNYGIPIHAPGELKEYILKAHNAGWQIATHAIGDRAVDAVLAAYAEAQRQNSRFLPGHRIEHCMLLDADRIARLRRQKVWSIGQPEFIARLGDAYILALGEERAHRLSPYVTLEQQNVAQAFSSDNPVVPGAPLDGLRAAMERKTVSGHILNEAECLSAELSLYAYTAAPAYATRAARDRGTIEIGKLADFTVLSGNPLTTPLSEWDSLQVEATFIGGECLYGAESFE